MNEKLYIPTGILARINGPADIKKLSFEELRCLADEVRDYITFVVSRNGGHLAPSLGAVEIIVALLYLYDPPRDKIIFDVGHQAYAYKILTDRKDKFPTLRRRGGISGFLKRSESPYDFFGAGHASTSLSAALGAVCARELSGEDYRVVAFIGDGALTGGLAFEGLNNLGACGKEILVILNDNKMSISKNVGALQRYLTYLIAHPKYRRLKEEIWDITGRLAKLGGHLRTFARKFEDSIKNMIVPSILFEEFGFNYYGPVDGHNIEELIRLLKDIKDVKLPKLVHIVTVKGKGYKPAEDDACKYHGIGRFDIESGEPVVTEGITFTDAFGSAITEFAEEDERILAITAAMTTGCGLQAFASRFPSRFFDVGIAEGHAVIFGASLALSGFKPVVCIYSTFLQRAFDCIVHDVALQNAPVVFAIDRAGIVGEDGPTHHGAFDLAYLRLIPNIIITAPKDQKELRDLLWTALKLQKLPFAIRYPRSICKSMETSLPPELIPVGSWEKLREGHSGAVLAVGPMVYTALEAACMLEREGIYLSVINCRFVKPLDELMLSEILNFAPFVLTIEEGTLVGGFGSAVLEFASKKRFDTRKIYSLGIPDEFIEHGSRTELLELLGLTSSGITTKVKEILGRGGKNDR